jgi:Short C-terminal domain
MRWFLCTIFGLGVAVFALACFEYSLFQMLQVGTCASGGPYESARECPTGIEVYFAGLFGGIIFGLIGIGIWSGRGPFPGTADTSTYGAGAMRVGGTGLLAWGVFFTVTGLVALYGAFGVDDPGPGAKTGGAIVGVLFILMGLPALIGVVGGAIGGRKAMRKLDPDAPGSPSTAPSGGSPSGPTTTIEGLGSLSGAGTAKPGGPVWPTPGSQATASPRPSSAPVPPSVSSMFMPPASTGASAAAGGGDPLARLEKLAKLRDTGALSQVEFDAAKAKILEEM